MISLATIIEPIDGLKEKNGEIFWELCRRCQPELYIIATALQETNINPLLLTPIIKMIGNLDIGNGFGSVSITMRDHVITMIKGEESIIVNSRVSLK